MNKVFQKLISKHRNVAKSRELMGLTDRFEDINKAFETEISPEKSKIMT